MPIQLIVGLGNPGAEYEETRHNAGVWFVEKIIQQKNLSLRHEKKFHGSTGKFNFQGNEYHLLIPSTYMNESGTSVLAFAHYYKIPPENILVAHDELDLAPGTTRLKLDGGHGGHNGLRDIIRHLGGKNFWRLRIGIGHPGEKSQVTDYVLHRPSATDRQLIDDSINEAIALLPEILSDEMHRAMNQLHTRDK